ncbi:hypothetical protein AU381_18750 [Sinorhizobium glycinis]|uniref:Uncharacterized protein n=1 Tax=Sinorhizobium glycinis TaxID=1472378 RepID=A0A178XMV4_9HYPH|nr:hypothetical protein [Sinorhizobium glycinis]OAP36536.1 hypothetical protein AU381_18750 [Sinorhizobium glycinis]
MSNIAVFPPRTSEDRARAADLQDARDRMLSVAAELDRIVKALSQEGLRAACEQAARTGT